MLEKGIYINKNYHTGQIKDALLQLTEVQIDLITFSGQQLHKIPANHELRATVFLIQKALAFEQLPERYIKKWHNNERALRKMLGAVDPPFDPQAIELKIEEFMKPITPFIAPAQAIHYLQSVEKSVKAFSNPELIHRIGSLAAAQRIYFINRILYHGFSRTEWLSRPDPIVDPDLKALVSFEPSQTSPQYIPRYYWLTNNHTPQPSIDKFNKEDSLDISNLRKFSLARLARFASLSSQGENTSLVWQNQTSRAVFTAFADCLDLGLGDQARQILKQRLPAYSTPAPTISEVLDQLNKN